jgi:hypothetical protein
MENAVCASSRCRELEAYKVLRTRIQQATKAKAGTPADHQPNSGDGKITAINSIRARPTQL